MYSHRSVPTPSCLPRNTAGAAGPPVSTIAGTSALAAPISCAGTVLSHPPSSTTASKGYARIDSSTSIAIRFRNSIVVGFINCSPSDIVGNSRGKPPAASTPRRTESARPRKCMLQFTTSDHELQIPTIGLPSNAIRENPDARMAERWTKPGTFCPANHLALRRVIGRVRRTR